MNYEEHAENLESPNVDLRSKKGNAYSHRSSAEGRRRFLDSNPVDVAAKVGGGEGLSDATELE